MCADDKKLLRTLQSQNNGDANQPDSTLKLKVGGPNKAHTLEKKCLQDSISQRIVQNLAHIWVNLLDIVRLQNIDLQLIIYWHRGHFLR